jgi:hypothetical protein
MNPKTAIPGESQKVAFSQQFPVEPTAEVCVPDFRIGRLG